MLIDKGIIRECGKSVILRELSDRRIFKWQEPQGFKILRFAQNDIIDVLGAFVTAPLLGKSACFRTTEGGRPYGD